MNQQILYKELGHESLAKVDSDGEIVREIRCNKCQTWLCDQYIFQGRLILQCHECGYKFKTVFKHQKDKLNGSS